MTTLSKTEDRYWDYALWLALLTIFYNMGEGIVSITFGVQDEALTLFGFGVDSFIEVLSGLGILAMVLRIRRNPDTPRSQFEQTALRITGAAFYLLAAGLGVTAIYNVATRHQPTTTAPGVIIALLSIAVMWALVRAKRHVGREPQLHAHPGRCKLHDGVHLYVGRAAGRQPGLSVDGFWLCGQHRRDRADLLLGERGARSFPESSRPRMRL